MAKYLCNVCNLDFPTRYKLYKHKNTHPKTVYECTYCDRIFHSRARYKAHQLDIHQVSDGQFLPNLEKCEYCSKSFSSIHGKKSHLKSCASAPVTSNTKFPYVCHEDKCNHYSKGIKAFMRHLEGHGLSFPKEELKFGDISDFKVWKEKEEIRNMVNYILRKREQRLSFLTLHYKCNRSGYYAHKTSRKRNLKRIGSCKLNRLCTSTILCHIFPSGEVQVTYTKTHYGHNLELQHLRMRPSEKALLRAKLLAGVKKQRMIKDSRNQPKSSSVSLLTRKQLRYLESSCGLTTSRQGLADILSVESSCDLMTSEQDLADTLSVQDEIRKMQNDSNIAKVFSKFPGEMDKENDLSVDDFVIYFFTTFQVEMCNKFMRKVICMDNTHGMSVHGFMLITVLIVDEFGEGVPVGWMLTNHETYNVIQVFLRGLKEVCLQNSVVHLPGFFMSDCAPRYFDAWVDVFGGDTIKLLCSFHVHKAWVGNLSLIPEPSLRSQVFKKLCTVMNLTDEEDAQAALHALIVDLVGRDSTRRFGQYFVQEWSDTFREWCLAFRKKSSINTNMYVEAFHKTLKYHFIKARTEVKVDICLSTLLEYAAHIEDRHRIKALKKPIGHRERLIIDSHKRSILFPPNIEALSPLEWEIKSTHGTQKYHVKKLGSQCSVPPCQLLCDACNVCVHMFTCTCPDWARYGTICKHIHGICTQTTQVPSPDIFKIGIVQPIEEVEPVGSPAMDYPTAIGSLASQLLNMAHLFSEPSVAVYAEEVRQLMTKALTIAKMVKENSG